MPVTIETQNIDVFSHIANIGDSRNSAPKFSAQLETITNISNVIEHICFLRSLDSDLALFRLDYFVNITPLHRRRHRSQRRPVCLFRYGT